MSTQFKHLVDRDYAIMYTFEKAGDGLPRHSHEAWDSHNIVVLTGMIALIYDGRLVETYSTGELAHVAWEKEHQVIALNDGTMVVNYFLKGQPEHYKNLPPEELEGSFNVHEFRK